ncbi:MAG TPA: hypothetical protein VMJ10_21660 [Kofleriaceae bacterium]|nr:hypothetical protein [Kofleriaceae bacterium]
MKRAHVVVAVAVVVAAAAILFSVWHRDVAPAPSSSPGVPAMPASARPAPARPQLPSPVPPELAAAKLERELAVGKLAQSGKVAAPWGHDGNLLLETIAHDGHAAGWTQVGCFSAGCAGTFLFASDDAMTHGRAIAEALDGYRAWTGDKHWTAPERWLDGRVSITLVLESPK